MCMFWFLDSSAADKHKGSIRTTKLVLWDPYLHKKLRRTQQVLPTAIILKCTISGQTELQDTSLPISRRNIFG